MTNQKVLFVCLHGAAKSVLAAADFERMAIDLVSTAALIVLTNSLWPATPHLSRTWPESAIEGYCGQISRNRPSNHKTEDQKSLWAFSSPLPKLGTPRIVARS